MRKRGRPLKGFWTEAEQALWDIVQENEERQKQGVKWKVLRKWLPRVAGQYKERYGQGPLVAAKGMLDKFYAHDYHKRAADRERKTGDRYASLTTTQGPQLVQGQPRSWLLDGPPWPSSPHPIPSPPDDKRNGPEHAYRSLVVYDDELPELYHVPVLIHLDQKPSVWFAQVFDIIQRWKQLRKEAGFKYPMRQPAADPGFIQDQIEKLEREKREAEESQSTKKPHNKRTPADRLQDFIILLGQTWEAREKVRGLDGQEYIEQVAASDTDGMRHAVLNVADKLLDNLRSLNVPGGDMTIICKYRDQIAEALNLLR